MKTFALIIKYVVIPGSSLLGIIYGFDMYIIQRANTVVEPTRVKLESVVETQKDIKKQVNEIHGFILYGRRPSIETDTK